MTTNLGHSTVTSKDGTAIAWYDFGGSGPDLLLAHATGFCARMWAPIVENLCAHFRCVAYDARGHGGSESPLYRTGPLGLDAWNWVRFTEDAHAVITAAALSNPFGVGHSSGGATELLLQERHPTFAALYLFEPVVFTDEPPKGPWPDRELAVRTRKRRAQFASRTEALDAFATKGPFMNLDRRALEAYIDFGFSTSEDGTVSLRCNPDDEADVYVMGSAHDAYLNLNHVEIPTTIAHGELSTSFSSEEMRMVADKLPSARFEEYDGLGHFGPLEDPDRFSSQVVKTFLG